MMSRASRILKWAGAATILLVAAPIAWAGRAPAPAAEPSGPPHTTQQSQRPRPEQSAQPSQETDSPQTHAARQPGLAESPERAQSPQQTASPDRVEKFGPYAAPIPVKRLGSPDGLAPAAPLSERP